MKLSTADLESLHDLAVATAEKAGAHIQSRVGNHSGPQEKDAGDTLASQVVTEVDHESQDLILESLADSITDYDLGLLTEESEDNSSRHVKEAFWCIDPIDGTLPFTEGVPGYSVSIALVSRAGTPLIGVVYDPVGKMTYHGFRGSGAMIGGTPLPEPDESQSDQLTWAMDRSMEGAPLYARALEELEILATQLGHHGLEPLNGAGSVLNACWAMRKSPSIYFKFPKPSQGGGSTWDFAATACLYAEWGLPPTDIHGAPLRLNPDGSTFMNEGGVVYSSDERISEAVREIYRAAGSH
ncbi:MAG: inositol monophosphatase family protein [Verrucomicrobiota bacterium]